MEEGLGRGNIEGSLISLMSNKVKTQGGINLAQGLPSFAPPKGLLRELKDILRGTYHQYPPGDGHPNLRDFLEQNYRSKGLTEYQFIITQGATEALSLCYNYLWSLTEGVLPSLSFDPAYESFIHLPRIFRQKLTLLSFQDSDSIDFEKLENCILKNQIRAIFVASPGNPLGQTLSREEWSIIFKLTAQYGIFLIADLVYDQLYFHKQQDIPFEEAHSGVFIVESFSKLFSITGWRIGALGMHAKHFQGVKNTHDYTGLCAPSLLQEALQRYITNHPETANRYIAHIRKQLSQNYSLATTLLKDAGFTIKPAQGGYFIWTQLPEGINDGLRFALELYDKTGVAVVPGIHFSKQAHRFIRINLARTPNEIKEGVMHICEFTRKIHDE
ncbi:MAG: hypothetical protein PWR20_1008 [Bacteroidales bacterium]|jgi:aspartate/methionine/tyrosine aminotransferase|nr:hypothetical protein [Bacteroidales bacterium]MDN5328313.1 hypothetical protein [Bacteroidales bacterium]